MLTRVAVLLFCLAVFPVNVNSKEVLLILDPGHGGYDHGGFQGEGFCSESGKTKQCMPEDAYTYDVAKRVELLAEERGWIVGFTVRDKKEKEHIIDSGEDETLSPRDTLIFNLPPPYYIVRSGRESLAKRVRAASLIRKQYVGATTIFVSLHFDYAPEYIRGAKVYTMKETSSLRLARAIADEASFSFPRVVRDQEYPAIDSKGRFYVLRRGIAVPRVLVELGNFNNPRDRACMLRSNGRQRYAQMMTDAIDEFLMHTN